MLRLTTGIPSEGGMTNQIGGPDEEAGDRPLSNNNQQRSSSLPQQQCFTTIQSRRLWSAWVTPGTCHLCPSMDLVVFGLAAPASATATATTHDSSTVHPVLSHPTISASMVLWLHRTLSWQALATMPATTTTTTFTNTTTNNNSASNKNDGDNDNDSINSKDSQQQQRQTKNLWTAVAWSPDGRILAVADQRGRVSLCRVEDLLRGDTHAGSPSLAAYATNITPTTAAPLTTTDFASHEQQQQQDSDNDNDPSSITPACFTYWHVPVTKIKSEENTMASVPKHQLTKTATVTTAAAANRVTAMAWAHGGLLHGDWRRSPIEQQAEIRCATCSPLGDRDHDHNATSLTLLPPSAYSYGGRPGSLDISSSSTISDWPISSASHTAMPTLSTPLNILVVASTTCTTATTTTPASASHGLHWYLQGRFPIAHVSFDDSPCTVVGTPNPLTKPMTRSASAVAAASAYNQNNVKASQAANKSSPFGSVANLAVSPDLTHTLTARSLGGCASSSSFQHPQQVHLSLHSLPALAQYRSTWQTISALYTSIQTHHLPTMRRGLLEIRSSWQAALRPLDQKLEGLTRLLQNYGLLPDITASTRENDGEENEASYASLKAYYHSLRGLLVQYILSGHTRASPHLSNAMDQFLTSMPMNDQLLVRMQGPLLVACAQVERQVRQHLLAPAQAMLFQVDTLLGLARYHDAPNTMLPLRMVHHFHDASRQLLLVVEHALQHLVQARLVTADALSWFRSTAARIKARGTAAHSVQRQNAHKRRVPDVVMTRMLQYLLSTSSNSNTSVNLPQRDYVGGLTEELLGLKFSYLLQNVNTGKPCTCKDFDAVEWKAESQLLVTIPQSLCHAEQNAHRVFEAPSQFMTQSLRRTDLIWSGFGGNSSPASTAVKYSRGPQQQQQQHLDPPLVAITTRLGRGGIACSPSNTTTTTATTWQRSNRNACGFFEPQDTSATVDSSTHAVRQWALVALHAPSLPPNNNKNNKTAAVAARTIFLHALPLTWTMPKEDMYDDNEDFDDEDDDWLPVGHDSVGCSVLRKSALAQHASWTILLDLPSEYTLHDMVFYSDDGKSSLSSPNMDRGKHYKEGNRQALALLVSKPIETESTLTQPPTATAATTTKATTPAAATTVSADTAVLEVWLVPYDDLTGYRYYPLTRDPHDCCFRMPGMKDMITNGRRNKNAIGRVMVQPIMGRNSGNCSHDATDDKQDMKNKYANHGVVVHVKTRRLSGTISLGGNNPRHPFLKVSGPRGIAAVFVPDQSQGGGSSLVVLDLEDDEDNDDDVEDNVDNINQNDKDAATNRGQSMDES